MNRHELEALYTLNNPATSQAIKMLTSRVAYLYPSYLQFLELSNGLFGDEITLLEAEDIQQRNIDYEVKEYLPNFLMIGDNGGGVAILMDNKNQNIFAVGMGVMSEDSLEKISSSLEDFLLVKKGMFKLLASCSPHKIFNPDVGCMRYARRFLFFRSVSIRSLKLPEILVL